MHGGDIYNKRIQYDFSMSINPLGVPESVQNAYLNCVGLLEHYPDIDCRVLGIDLGAKLGVDPGRIVFGNGASELLPAFFRAMKIKKALLPVPCFSGYDRALKSCDAEVTYFQLLEENNFEITSESFLEFRKKLILIQPDCVVLTNPNNPNGKLLNKSVLHDLQKVCEELGIYLLLDECFFELAKADYVSRAENFSTCFYLRAFTKSFAIPGLRLGYIICANGKIAELIKIQLPEWNVSIPAQTAGIECLKETEYLEQSRMLIMMERFYLEAELRKFGFKVYPSDVNYILFYYDQENKPDLREELIKKEILIRDCSDYIGLKKGYYRVAVKNHPDNQILVKAIEEIINAD